MGDRWRTNLDRAFICGIYDRCGGSLDLVVDGEEVGQALGLDPDQDHHPGHRRGDAGAIADRRSITGRV